MAITFPDGAEWPPKPYDRAMRDMRRYQAWYSGDVDELSDIYSATEARQRMSTTTGRITYNSDVFFWGRDNPQGTKRRHVPAAANVSRASSDLLFSQPPKIIPGPDDEDNATLTARMELIFGDDRFSGLLSEAGETASVLGGVYLVPWWDEAIADHVQPGIRDADHAIPEWAYDRLTAVTFWNQISNPGDSPVVRHLERHERGTITHALYSGTENSLGSRVPLDSDPATGWAVDITNEDGEIPTGYDRMHVIYIPNVRPTRAWRNDPILGRLGRSDYEGLEGEFDALDEVNTSWLRDVENAKSRIFVDERLLSDDGPGRGGSFDIDRQVYTTTRPTIGLDAGNSTNIETNQFDIRVDEHSRTTAEIVQHILQAVGISAQQFTDGPLSIGATATEVNSRNAISENTRQKKINYWTQGLTEFVTHVIRLDAIHFNTDVVLNSPPEVKFPARAVQSESEQAQIIATKRGANVISVKTAVQTLNPDWSTTEVDEEIKRIRDDQMLETKLAYGQGLEDGTEGEDPGATEGMEDPETDTEDTEDTEDPDTVDAYGDESETPDTDYLRKAVDDADDAEQEQGL